MGTIDDECLIVETSVDSTLERCNFKDNDCFKITILFFLNTTVAKLNTLFGSNLRHVLFFHTHDAVNFLLFRVFLSPFRLREQWLLRLNQRNQHQQCFLEERRRGVQKGCPFLPQPPNEQQKLNKRIVEISSAYLGAQVTLKHTHAYKSRR